MCPVLNLLVWNKYELCILSTNKIFHLQFAFQFIIQYNLFSTESNCLCTMKSAQFKVIYPAFYQQALFLAENFSHMECNKN